MWKSLQQVWGFISIPWQLPWVQVHFCEDLLPAFTGSSSLQRQSKSSNCWKDPPCIELKSIRDHCEVRIQVLSCKVQIFKCLEEQAITSVWAGEKIIDGSLKLQTLKISIERRLKFCQSGRWGRCFPRKKSARTNTSACQFGVCCQELQNGGAPSAWRTGEL